MPATILISQHTLRLLSFKLVTVMTSFLCNIHRVKLGFSFAFIAVTDILDLFVGSSSNATHSVCFELVIHHVVQSNIR